MIRYGWNEGMLKASNSAHLSHLEILFPLLLLLKFLSFRMFIYNSSLGRANKSMVHGYFAPTHSLVLSQCSLCESFTQRGGLSHNVYSFWSSVHPSLAPSSCMSKFQRMRAKIERISKNARLSYWLSLAKTNNNLSSYRGSE